MSRRFLPLLPVLFALLIFGCGGGGGGHSKPGGTGITSGETGVTTGITSGDTNGGTTNGGYVLVSPRITIAWPAQVRPRAIEAPVFATGVLIRFTPVEAGWQSLNARLSRPAGQDAVTETTTLGGGAVPGNYTLDVRFVVDEPSDIVTAQATLPVKLLASGEIQRADGTPLGTVVTEGKITGVRIPYVPSLDPGDTFRPGVIIDIRGGINTFAAPPGLLKLEVTSGGDVLRLNNDNTVTALAPGTATVVASVPGFTSPPTTFTVASDPVLPSRIFSFGTGTSFVYPLYEDPTRGHFWAINGGAAVEIDPASETVVRQIVSLGEIGSFSLSDDGTTIYTTTRPTFRNEKYQFVRHDAATGAVLGSIDYGTTPIGGVAIQPGRNDVVAVGLGSTSPGEPDRVAIFDGITPRPNAISPAGTPVWLSETRLAIMGSGIRTATVDAQGLTLDGVANPDFQFAADVTVADGRIYARDGVYDAATLALIGRFTLPPDSSMTVPPVVANGLVFFCIVKDDTIQIATYRVSDRSFVRVQRIEGHPNAQYTSQLRRYGAHGLAVNAYTHLILLDEVPGL